VKVDQPVPRNALAWIIISMFALVAPHAERIPAWVLAIYLAAAGWRTLVYQGRWSFPGRAVKLALIVASFTGIYFSFGTLLGLEPTVALLLTAFALKLIELVHRKDAYVLLFLGYFLCVTQFLFSQELPVVLYMTVCVTLVTTALVALHQPGEHQFQRGSLRLAAVMLAQSLPLMVVLFFLFPRFAPLWTVPFKIHSAKTGITDFMRPGDISRLGQSAEVAFRARFTGEVPPSSQLYWRGLVLSRLEEGAWRSLRYYDIPVLERRTQEVVTAGAPLQYSIVMAPTQQQWLYGLRYARSPTPGVMASTDFRLFTPGEVEDEYLYEVQSWPDATLEPSLSAWRRETELQLPEGENPRTVALARTLRQQFDSDVALADAVLAMFTEQPFVYTLRPPLLPETDPMDAFLFDTRRGFCEHFAYAFTVLMRAAGVPARVVTGYQGGEVNPVSGAVVVHQFDAHAWSEVWLPGRGWVRVDPTAAVSPSRIERGLEEAMAEEGSFLSGSPLSLVRYRSIAWLNRLRLRYDAFADQWQRWVLGFDSRRQIGILQDLLGELSGRKFATLLVGSWVLVLVPVAFFLLRRGPGRRLHPLDRDYLALCERLARRGLARTPGEAPGSYAARVARGLPDAAPVFSELTALYSRLCYGDSALDAGRRSALAREFHRRARRFRPPRR